MPKFNLGVVTDYGATQALIFYTEWHNDTTVYIKRVTTHENFTLFKSTQYTEQHISHSEVTWSISTQWIYLRWRRFISQWN